MEALWTIVNVGNYLKILNKNHKCRSEWVFFVWYQLTRIILDKEPLNRSLLLFFRLMTELKVLGKYTSHSAVNVLDVVG